MTHGKARRWTWRKDAPVWSCPETMIFMSNEQLDPIPRQIILKEIGIEGQRRLFNAKVLVDRRWGLGFSPSIYLAAAGVGTIGIVDADRVDRSNLHRQVLHFDQDVGRPKTESAREHLEALNPGCRVVEYQERLDSSNALEIIAPYDVVINGCDNFPTRYLVNDACVLLKKPLVDASILRFEGQATVYIPGQGCYRCLFPKSSAPGLGAQLRRGRHHRGVGGPHGNPASPGGDQGAARHWEAPGRPDAPR